MPTEARAARAESHAAETGAFDCPVCRRTLPLDERVSPQGLEPDLVRLVVANTPGWHGSRGLCRGCAGRFRAALAYMRTHEVPVESAGTAILPTPLRLGALDRFRGRGVTIAFLDSGFYAHPDLVEPTDRIQIGRAHV